MQSHETGQVASLAHLLVNGIGHFLGLVPFGDIWLDFGVDPCADFGSQGFMCLIVVGRVILSWLSAGARVNSSGRRTP